MSINTKATTKPERQIRLEHIIRTRMDDEEVAALAAHMSGELSNNIESAQGNEHILTTFQDMNDVSKTETDRIQAIYDKETSEEEPVAVSSGKRR